VTGTFINVAAILAGTLVGAVLGGRMPEGLQRRVLMGLGLVVLVIGMDLALAWRDTGPLYVLGGVLLGGLVGELLGIEDRLAALALAAITVLVYQGALSLGATLFEDVLQGEALDALTSAGGVLILGISLKLLEVTDVMVRNFLPALIFAPALVGIVSLVD
jgi:uncharacterized membrane protein YqgA involved in biofilm formation